MTFMQEIGRNVALMSQGFNQESLEMFLHLYAIQAKKTIFQQEAHGYLVDPDGTDLVSLLSGILPDMHLANVHFPNSQGDEQPKIRNLQISNGRTLSLHSPRHQFGAIALWEGGFFLLVASGAGWRRVRMFSVDPDQVTACMAALHPCFEQDGTKARMGVVVSSQHGMQIRHIGQAKADLCRDNYAPEVLRVFDHIVEEIVNPAPCGRLSILLGPPGTGKTYFLEGLTRAQPKARYILLPANLISALTGPELLMSLTGELDDEPEEGSSKSSLPIVFIVEDADECLVTRGTDNHPAISSLLNLADGILGRCLDVRIIATSNAKRQDIDKALLRPGRICQVAHFDTLTTEHASAVFRRLVRDQPDFIGCGISQPSTLAEVYQASRQLEAPPERKPSVIGFAV